MVAFGAAAAFFVVFLCAYCFSKKTVTESKVVKDCEGVVSQKKVLFYTYCSSVSRDEAIYDTVLYEEEDEEFPKKYENFRRWTKYPTSRIVALLSPDICTNLNITLYSEFMKVLSGLLPPEGTIAVDIFRTVLIISGHLSSYFLKEFQILSSSSVRVDIIFDADFEAVLGRNVEEFKNFLLWHLKLTFCRSQSDIHTLIVKKGSIGITFFLNSLKCVHSMKQSNQHTISDASLYPGDKNQNHLAGRKMSSENEFLSFLRYLNYHQSFNYHKSLKRVPFSVKTSSLERSNTWTKKLNLLDAEMNKGNFLKNEDILFSEMTSTLEYDAEMHPEMPLKFETKSSKRNTGNAGGNLHEGIFGLGTYKDLHRNRIRRYVQRNDEDAMKLKVQLKLDKPAKSGNTEEFQRHIVSQIAQAIRVPIPSIKDLEMTSDSDISFILTAFNDENNKMDDISVHEAADTLKTKMRSQQLRLKDLNGQLLMITGSAYASVDETSSDYSLVILVILCITMLMITILIVAVIYIARRISQTPPKSVKRRDKMYKNFQDFGRESSQSIGKYSYDSGLWLGPGPEPNFTVPEAPYYRPPTEEQIASTPRPVTAVRTRLKRNWNVDERALSTIPDNHRRNYIAQETPPPR